MQADFLVLKGVGVTLGGDPVLRDINLSWKPGQQWALTGDSGSGKSTLARVLAGQQFYSGEIYTSFTDPAQLHRAVTLVPQQHLFRSLAGQHDFYYQQRYNAADAQQTITLRQAFKPADDQFRALGLAMPALIDLFQLRHLLDEPLIQLSNGENKRLQTLNALLEGKPLIILDQPFTGLDVAGRELLHQLIDRLTEAGMRLMLITTPKEISGAITHVAVLSQGKLSEFTADSYSAQPGKLSRDSAIHPPRPVPFAPASLPALFRSAVRMENVTVRYDQKIILNDISWEVKKGERWLLTGPNGAGKSTLLSLITADNPQAYANKIYLFDRRRGSGESIWDIKEKIGYVSPELHLHFDSGFSVHDVVASGLFDTIGLFRLMNDAQEMAVMKVLRWFDLEKIQMKRLALLPLGQQRMVLLARAFVKAPPLLILDEPGQGLDEVQTAALGEKIDQYCLETSGTLIYVSHYTQDLPTCIDHELRLFRGAVVITNANK